MKRSLVAENQLFGKTVFLQVLLHFGTEIQTVGFAVLALKSAVTVAYMASPADAYEKFARG
jgi:hypothetical protein